MMHTGPANSSEWEWGPASEVSSPQRGELWQVVLSHKLLLAVLMIFGGGLGYLSYVKAEPTYRSAARLHFVQSEPAMRFDAVSNVDLLSVGTKMETHAILIQTPLIRRRALDILAGVAKPTTSPANDEALRKDIESEPAEKSAAAEGVEADAVEVSSATAAVAAEPAEALPVLAVVESEPAQAASEPRPMAAGPPLLMDESTFERGLNAVPNRDSAEILDLTFTSANPEWSRRALAAVIEAYLGYLKDTQQSSAKKATDLFKQARSELSVKIDLQEREYATFRKRAKLLWDGDVGSNIHALRLQEIEASRSKLLISRTQSESDLESIQRALDSGASSASLALMILQLNQKDQRADESVSSSQVLSKQLLPLLLEEKLLLQKLGANHPKVRDVQKRIEALRAISKETETPVDGADDLRNNDRSIVTAHLAALKHDVEVKTQQLAKLDDKFREEQREAEKISGDENEDRTLREKLDRLKKMFDVVMSKLESAELTDDVKQVSAQTIIEPGPGGRILAPAYQFVSLGSFGGLMVGLLIAFLLEWSDKGYRTSEEMTRDLAAPIFGHVPALSSSVRNTTTFDPTVVTLTHPKSQTAEAYRVVRSILLKGADSAAHRVIQVTSPTPGDGKSTLAANLAAAIATVGKRCLLIDCDLRRPRVHKLFNLSNVKGCTSVLRGECELPDAVHANVVPLLDVLTSGPKVQNPSELLMSRQFADFVELLRDQYDIVIVDSPPVLAVSEPASLATLMDGVLMVLKMSRKTRPMARQAKAALELVGANLLGLVVNGPSTGGTKYYSSNSYYSYGYRNDYYVDDTGDEPVAAVNGREYESAREPQAAGIK